MVALFTMRTYGVNQVFRFVEGIWLHRKSCQVSFNFRKRPILLYTCATCSELPSYISTMSKTHIHFEISARSIKGNYTLMLYAIDSNPNLQFFNL